MKKKLLFFTLALSFSLTACQNTPVMNEVTEEAVVTEEVIEPEEIVEEEFVGEPFNVEDFDYTFKEFYRLARAKENAITRDLPAEIGHKLGVLEPLEEVVVTAQCNETSWYRIEKDGEIFYVDYNNLKFIFNKDIEYPEGYTENGYKIIDYTEKGFPIVGYTENGEAIADYENNGEPVIYFASQDSGSNSSSKNSSNNVSEINPEDILGYTEKGDAIIAYADNGSPIIGYTSEGYAISEYDEDGSPICYFVPSVNTSSNNSNSSNGSLPYIVNGIDIRDGDYNGDGINDNNGNTWYQMQTWTASNGYTLRIADAYYVNPGPLNPNDAVFVDGTENREPTSPFKVAVNEYMGLTSLATISPKDLPQVNTVSSKQTSINVNDPSLLAYKAAFDPLWQKQNGGNFSNLTFDSNGIALLDVTTGLYYLWDISYDASRGDWSFMVLGSYTELGWDAVKNSLRMITPDADAVFDAIYKDCYYGGGGLECEKYGESNWITIGSTQVKADWTSGTLYFRFK